MATRRRIVVLTVLVSLPTIAALYFGLISMRVSNEESMQQTVSIMRTRLRFLESQYIQQEQLLNQARSTVPDNIVNNITLTPELQALLRNISGHNKGTELVRNSTTSIHPPLSVSLMHGIGPPRIPFRITGRPRQGIKTIVGVPTVYRQRKSYVQTTMKHLINGLTKEQKDNTVIVLYIGETDLEFVIRTAYNIKEQFAEELESGLIEIISPDKDYYPDFDTMPLTLGDSRKRTKWRTKQNLDAIFLMSYAQPRCMYYLMVEDDIIAENGYMTASNIKHEIPLSVLIPFPLYYKCESLDVCVVCLIPLQAKTAGKIWLKLLKNTENGTESGITHTIIETTEIEKYTATITDKQPDWFFIQYSTTGGIGKLFRTDDLIRFTAYLQLFYANMPIDWLLETYLADRVCGIGRTTKQCGDAKSQIRPTYKKNLFKHIGVYSSLKGKIQKVENHKDFHRKMQQNVPADETSEIQNFEGHVNPPTKAIKCTLIEEPEHTVEFLYEGSTYAWLHNAKKNDVIEFWFREPIKMTKYIVNTASAMNRDDRLYDSVFEAKPNNGKEFIIVDVPDEFGMFDGLMDDSIGLIEAVRIRFLNESRFWLMITGIQFSVKDDKD